MSARRAPALHEATKSSSASTNTTYRACRISCSKVYLTVGDQPYNTPDSENHATTGQWRSRRLLSGSAYSAFGMAVSFMEGCRLEVRVFSEVW